MLVLLPPSEGKAPSGRGAPLKPESLSLAGLAGARQAVLDELVELCAADEDKAREVLGLSEGLRGEIAKNVELRTAGARPAGEIYTGSSTTRSVSPPWTRRRSAGRRVRCWCSRACGARCG